MFIGLAALIAGILLGPCLESSSVCLCLPPSILIALARPRYALLPAALLGAGLAAMQPEVPRDPGDTAVRLVGRLRQAPQWHGLGIYLDVQLQTVDSLPCRGRARLTEFLDDPETRRLFEELELGSGDRLEILVRLRRPTVYRNPGVFDFRRHLERQGIYWTGTIRSPRLITVLDRGWHGPDRVRNWIQARLETPFEGDRRIQGLLSGMVLGRKHGLTAEVEQQFQAGGLYHLVVVSGFNLAVVSGVALWIVRFITWKRPLRLLLVLASTLAYGAMVEGQSPVTRAVVMVCFLIAGKLLDRGYAALNTLAAAAAIILLFDPTSIEDSSFQMTFAAVAAVIGLGVPASQWALGWLRDGLRDFNDTSGDGYLSPRAADWRITRRVWCELHGLPGWTVTLPWKTVLIIGEAAIVSLSVELVFLVFMVESFHRFSPVAPLLNIPAGMIAAAVTPLGLLLIFLPGPAASIVAWIITQLLGALLGVLAFAVELPGTTLRVPSVPVWLWIVYGGLVLLLTLAIHRRWLHLCMGSLLAVVSLHGVITLGDFSPAPPEAVRLTFLDVGQGDSTLIEFPSGNRMLIDGGGAAAGRFLNLRDESTFSIGEDVVSAYLFSRGIRRLDTVVLTHAHHDHMDGLFDVIENFQVGEFWLGRNPMTPRYRHLIEQIQERQIPIRWVSAGQKLGPFTVLHPPANWIPRKNAQNDDSVVLLLDTGRATALLTGDIERRIAVPDDQVDVLKVPHHGSKGVRTRVPATVRIISVGTSNPFGHPHESALPALRTDRLGAITVTLAGETPRFSVATALTEPCQSCKLAILFGSH